MSGGSDIKDCPPTNPEGLDREFYDHLQGTDPYKGTQILHDSVVVTGKEARAGEHAFDTENKDIAMKAPRCPHKDPACRCDGFPVGSNDGAVFSRINGDRSEYSDSINDPFLSAEEIAARRSVETRTTPPNFPRCSSPPIRAAIVRRMPVDPSTRPRESSAAQEVIVTMSPGECVPLSLGRDSHLMDDSTDKPPIPLQRKTARCP